MDKCGDKLRRDWTQNERWNEQRTREWRVNERMSKGWTKTRWKKKRVNKEDLTVMTNQGCRIFLNPILLVDQPHLKVSISFQKRWKERELLTSCSAKRWSARLVGGVGGWSHSWQMSPAPSSTFPPPSSWAPSATFSSRVQSSSFFSSGWKSTRWSSINWPDGSWYIVIERLSDQNVWCNKHCLVKMSGVTNVVWCNKRCLVKMSGVAKVQSQVDKPGLATCGSTGSKQTWENELGSRATASDLTQI